MAKATGSSSSGGEEGRFGIRNLLPTLFICLATLMATALLEIAVYCKIPSWDYVGRWGLSAVVIVPGFFFMLFLNRLLWEFGVPNWEKVYNWILRLTVAFYVVQFIIFLALVVFNFNKVKP